MDNIRQTILDFVNKPDYRPRNEEAIIDALGLTGQEIGEFFAAVDELVEEAVLFRNRSGFLGLPAMMNLIVGRLNMSVRGYGFIVPDNKEDTGEEDVFVPGANLMSAMHGDRVIARVSPSEIPGRAREGEIIRIVERVNTKIVGTFESSRSFGFVTPDNPKIGQDIFINNSSKIKSGAKVVCEIIKWPGGRRNAEGKIIEVLGMRGDPGVDILSVIKAHDLPTEFPEAVQEEAAALPPEVLAAELEGRLDRRALTAVTIDGDDSKDFDDAVYAERRGEDLFLGVYIADVSHYVQENTPLDREARSRGTSVYLVDRVIPMLPVELSNGICSLNEGVDRLAMACEMLLGPDGAVKEYHIAPAVIRSRRRLTYNIVNKILIDQNERLTADNADILPMLKALKEVRAARLGLRKRRGAINFTLPEIKVKLDENGHPVAIVKRIGSLSESIIEECMLAANETVAAHLCKKHLPSIYRVHEEPTEEKIERFNALLASFGQHIRRSPSGKVKPMKFQKILDKVKGRPEEQLVSKVALRSMQQACYMPENLGHFGLAAKYYTHFTSPIRRYPDLIVHRILRESLSGKLSKERQEKLRAILPEWADHSSVMERVAQDAERETAEMKAVEYMAQFVGEAFSGIISSVTAFGLFVELETGVEGLAHISRMVNDYYAYDEANFRLVGGRTGEVYRLGDEIEVVLVRADVETRELDLIIKGNGVYVAEDVRKAKPAGRKKAAGEGAKAKAAKGKKASKEKAAGGNGVAGPIPKSGRKVKKSSYKPSKRSRWDPPEEVRTARKKKAAGKKGRQKK